MLAIVIVVGTVGAIQVVPGARLDVQARASRVEETPVGGQLTWVLAQLNGDAERLTPEDIVARTAAAFLSVVSPEQVVAGFQDSANAGPFRLAGFVRPPTDTQAVALVNSRAGDSLVVALAVESSPPHRITGIQVQPVSVADGNPLDSPTNIAGRFDIGGRAIYLSCRGTGSPTVILESGYGDSAALWAGMEGAVAPRTRVCSYDRANTVGGASDPAPSPRTAREVVGDLHAVLAAAGVPGPYVLVGHSIGGLFVRLYASAYPDDVAALVLVDSSHEDQDVRLEAIVPAEMWEARRRQFEGFDIERVDLTASFAWMREARLASPPRTMPLVVLTAGRPLDPAEFPLGWPVEATERMGRELHQDLATLAVHATHRIAEDSGHYILLDRPDVVIEGIGQVIDSVRGTR